MNKELDEILNGKGTDVIYLRVPYSFKEYFVKMALEKGMSHREYGKVVKEILTQFITYTEENKGGKET